MLEGILNLPDGEEEDDEFQVLGSTSVRVGVVKGVVDTKEEEEDDDVEDMRKRTILRIDVRRSRLCCSCWDSEQSASTTCSQNKTKTNCSKQILYKKICGKLRDLFLNCKQLKRIKKEKNHVMCPSNKEIKWN